MHACLMGLIKGPALTLYFILVDLQIFIQLNLTCLDLSALLEKVFQCLTIFGHKTPLLPSNFWW